LIKTDGSNSVKESHEGWQASLRKLQTITSPAGSFTYTVLLLILGWVGLLTQFYDVYVSPKRSTAGLGLLVAPFVLLLTYVVSGLIVALKRKYHERKL
jgi:hypothetical protein